MKKIETEIESNINYDPKLTAEYLLKLFLMDNLPGKTPLKTKTFQFHLAIALKRMKLLFELNDKEKNDHTIKKLNDCCLKAELVILEAFNSNAFEVFDFVKEMADLDMLNDWLGYYEEKLKIHFGEFYYEEKLKSYGINRYIEKCTLRMNKDTSKKVENESRQ